MLLEYDTSVAADKFFSLVDNTLNSGNDPCAVGAIAAASADNLHSGVMQGKGTGQTGNGRILEVPQAALLDASKEYAVCYTTGAGDSSSTWVNAEIKLRVSKVHYVTAYGVQHRTSGTIPSHPSLTMRYTGTLLNNRWISLVDVSLNGGAPCGTGIIAAAPKDSSHSGSILAGAAGGNVFVVDTDSLSGTATFAVCYAESGGITSSVWRDSGIRLKRSAIKQVVYGVDELLYGDGSRRISYNEHTDDADPIATAVFPRVANAKLEYIGELEETKWISLVDDSIADPDGAGTITLVRPCLYLT